MNNDIIKTGVDELLELLEKTDKIPVTQAAQKLEIPVDILQTWVDFLVEESIIGIEYRFTTPYIYLNKTIKNTSHEVAPKTTETIPSTIDDYKQEFSNKARTKNIPESQIDRLWRNHLAEELDRKKKYFFFEANNRKLTRVNELWEEYKNILLNA